MKWFSKEVNETIHYFNTSIDQGLSESQIALIREKVGLNELRQEKRDSWLLILFRQFTNLLIVILVLAAIIAYFAGETGDSLTIGAIIILNGLLGFLQEYRAETALQALRTMLAPKCSVLRNGKTIELDARYLVPGDIIFLSTGNILPADIRLVETHYLKIEESSLTGESDSIEKNTKPVAEDALLSERYCMGWMGTTITHGKGKGIVTSTGMNTEIGKIAKLTQSVDTSETPLQRELGKLAKQLGIFSIMISIIMGLIGVLSGKGILEMSMLVITLAVAAIPEGLPAVVTITLALGIKTMVKKNALLRRLQAAEALGAATVICTDKTGTLTKNEMTARSIYTPEAHYNIEGTGYSPTGKIICDQEPFSHYHLNQISRVSILCSNASLSKENDQFKIIGEPTEGALIVLSIKSGYHIENQPHIKEIPFSSIRKKMTVVTIQDDTQLVSTKGAPEFLLKSCSRFKFKDMMIQLNEEERQKIILEAQKMAQSGLRVLAFAGKSLSDHSIPADEELESDLEFFGLVGIQDPPRDEVAAAIDLAKKAGIRTIVITGDATETALSIARQVGLSPQVVLTGLELEKMTDRQLEEEVKQEILFSRTSPEHKLRIVKALQASGNIIAMTGDGVNDAPALKQANIGVAMGIRGTDVAKASSEIILLDDNYASIMNAVSEGRRQFDNIQKFVRYLLSSNIGEIFAIFFGLLIGGYIMFLPAQLLWINLVTDGMTAIALGLEPLEKRVMERPPRPLEQKIIDFKGFSYLSGLGLYMAVACIYLFHVSADGVENLKAGTMAFTAMVMLEKINVFNFRALRSPLHETGFFSNPWLLIAWVIELSLQLVAIYVPFFQKMLHTTSLTWADWGTILIWTAPVFIVPEVIKSIWLKKQQPNVR